jgi:hypothetical protein
MKTFKLYVIALSLLFTQPSVGRNVHSQNHSSDDSIRVIEKVYLHVDRDNYTAGDDVWFKAYLIDGIDRLLTDHSSNLHVELISPSSKIISSRVVRLVGGLGNGDFNLPVDIKSGRYKLRAYTNYMRNFSDGLFFNKEIIVINSADSTEIHDEVKYEKNQIRLSFFPEGGSLLDNVSSNVAFKAENSLGKGCDVSGKIFSSKGDFIAAFKSTHLGMGSFFLRPMVGLSYYSVYSGADSVDFKTQLPASFPIGVTFSISPNRNNELLLTTKTNPQTLALISDHELSLSFSIRKEVFKTIPCKINSPVTSFAIPTDDLPDGILMLTLSTLKDLPLAERLVYVEQEAPGKINIETDKPLYNKREPVSLRLFLSNDSTIERDGNVSLAVVNENLIQNTSQYPRNISSWFLLESDVRGNVEDPSYYFDPSNPKRLSDLDLLLRTQGWRDFGWKYDKEYFPPENGFKISGRLRKYYTNKPIAGSRVSVGIFGGNSTFVTSVPVDSSGKFKLSGIELTGEARLIVSGIDQKDRMKGILILDSVTYKPERVPDSLNSVSVLAENFNNRVKSYYKINESISKKYKLSDTIGLGEVNIISHRPIDLQIEKIERSRAKYGTPEGELIITEQLQSYKNIPELIKGRFAGVEVLGTEPDYIILIRKTPILQGRSSKPGSNQGNPLILIDGNHANFEDLKNMPVNFIERIDVLKSAGATSIFGMEGFDGVINLITRTGGSAAFKTLVEYSANIRISGYHTARIFYSPTHSADSNSDYKPDLRSTLLWKPDINLRDNKGVMINYFNGDNSSRVRVIAEGITSAGIPVTGKAEYEVR